MTDKEYKEKQSARKKQYRDSDRPEHTEMRQEKQRAQMMERRATAAAEKRRKHSKRIKIFLNNLGSEQEQN